MSKEKKKSQMMKKEMMMKGIVKPHLKRSKLTMRNPQKLTMKKILRILETFLGTMYLSQE